MHQNKHVLVQGEDKPDHLPFATDHQYPLRLHLARSQLTKLALAQTNLDPNGHDHHVTSQNNNTKT